MFSPPTSFDPTLAFQQLGLATLLGLLVGLQREHVGGGMPGLRTFPLITVLGTASALLAQAFGGWTVAAGLLALVGMAIVPSLLRLKQAQPQLGMTTNVAVLLMYTVGALLVVAPMAIGVVIAGGVAVLLQFKLELHQFSAKLGDADLRAIMQFVLLTCIILPVLPNHTYDPLGVLNPFEIRLVVVLIVGISLGGYIAYKFLGREAGIVLGGVLGGAISSTAVTVSSARQARENSGNTQAAATMILIASTVVYVRLLAEIAVVSRRLLMQAAGPLTMLMVLSLLAAWIVWRRARNVPAPMPEHQNPTQLAPALVFGAMYALVLFALAAVKHYTSGHAIYLLAAISGVADLDALNLSTARLAESDPSMLAHGWRLIVVGVVASMAFRVALAAGLGSSRLAVRLACWFCLPLVGAVLLLLLWPA